MQDEGKQLHVRVPEEIYKKLKVTCVYEDTSMQDYVAKLIAESVGEYWLDKQPPKKRARAKSRRRR